ncbi:YesL family protein [Bifidobacterium sp.]|uniref:YesL family protein n=1 Tax=Bifidobacterium sp. TaxID=41200 RepID=UPI0025C4691B|nr:DUF624 domain-containing protein [Bifidobacterium sp.]MCI1635754.1 DUF624 domain-containing protein [Bifidobacterium sp.]
MLSRFSTSYERLCRTVVMIFIVNVAMLFHTLMGVFVVGFFPSIAAAHATYRAWLLSDDRSWTVKHTWSTFHSSWKQELSSANAFGWPMGFLWILLIFDYWVVNWHDVGGHIGIAVSGALVVLIAFFGVFTLLAWVLRSNFDESGIWVAKTTIQMVVARPLCSLMTTLLFILTVWVWYTWPGVLVVFGLSVPAFLSSIVVYSYARLPGMDIHSMVAATSASPHVTEGK